MPSPKIYQIRIPKGSPVIVFTNDLFYDKLEPGKVFGEPQAEVLLDPINFDFENVYSNSRVDENGNLINRSDYIATPKYISSVNAKSA